MRVLQCNPFDKILNAMLHSEVTCIDTRIIMLTLPILVFRRLYTLTVDYEC